MRIYSRKANWKIGLAIMGLLIVLASLTYTGYVARQIQQEEYQKIATWAKAVSLMTKVPIEGSDQRFTDESINYLTGILTGNKNIPAILTDEWGYPIDFINIDTSKVSLEQSLAQMRTYGDSLALKDGSFSFHVHFDESSLLKQLKIFPYLQMLLIAIFVGVSYWLFSWARRSEENQVWVGLAKETAHQLGTPISGMIAWIELLKSLEYEDEMLNEATFELGRDVERLEQIAERFSKIGAKPELTPQDILPVIERNLDYIARRAPQHIQFVGPESDAPMMAAFNASLFDWVLENLLRNALDAMEAKGEIRINVQDHPKHLYIDVSDTGRGIPSNLHQRIFKPGFSTKKRGWGLGLSLTQRIIKKYHSGKIFVLASSLEEGTTFRIILPKSAAK